MKNSTLKSILASLICLMMFSLVNSQISPDTTVSIADLTLASGTGQAGGDFKDLNFGSSNNNALCNFDDNDDLMTYYEAWIKFEVSSIEEAIPEGEMLLFAEVQLEVTANTGQGFYAYHLMDIDDWKEGDGNGNTKPDNTEEGMTWTAAQSLDYENEANYTLIHTNAGLPSGQQTFDIKSAIEYELGEEGNKILTLRLAPTIDEYIQNDPVYGKKWLGFFTRESCWGDACPLTDIHPAAPRIVYYVGPEQPTEFSDIENFGDIGNYDITPGGFQQWIIGDDEGDARLVINGRPAPIDGTPGGLAMYNMDTYGDFDISVKAKLNKEKDAALDPKADFIIAFGYEDGKNYSYMRFTGEDINGFYLVDSADGGTVTEVGDLNTTPAVSDMNYHNYRLVRSGTTVTAYIDGTEYMSVTDDALGTEGTIGMGSYNDIALFDDFKEGEGEPISVDDLYQAKFNIYPNPAGDQLYIEAESNMNKVVITNTIGQEILTLGNIRSGSVNINTSGFESGLYFITVYGDNDRPFTGKFIKK